MPDLDTQAIREQASKLAELRDSLEWPAKELPWKVTGHEGSFSASNDMGDEREECDVFESGDESTVAFVVAAVSTPWDEHAVRLCDEVERLRREVFYLRNPTDDWCDELLGDIHSEADDYSRIDEGYGLPTCKHGAREAFHAIIRKALAAEEATTDAN